MTEEMLREFIARIISSGKEENIKSSLGELASILEYDGADAGLISMVRDLSDTAREAFDLGVKKKGAPVTKEEIASAIRDGRIRIERESRRC